MKKIYCFENLGTYTLTYSVSDSSGNTDTVVRTVKVIENNEKPAEKPHENTNTTTENEISENTITTENEITNTTTDNTIETQVEDVP